MNYGNLPNMIDPDGGWIRSTRCGPNGQTCVEVNFALGRRIALRDSKCGEVLTIDRSRWAALLDQVAR